MALWCGQGEAGCLTLSEVLACLEHCRETHGPKAPCGDSGCVGLVLDAERALGKSRDNMGQRAQDGEQSLDDRHRLNGPASTGFSDGPEGHATSLSHPVVTWTSSGHSTGTETHPELMQGNKW